jgi:hypothetical protein
MGPEILLYIQIAAMIIKLIQSSKAEEEVNKEAIQIIHDVPGDMFGKMGRPSDDDVKNGLDIVRFILKIIRKEK